MKICTVCNTTYSDDALNFCLTDGSMLISKKDVSFDQVPFPYEPGSWSDEEVPTQVSGRPVSSPNSEAPLTAAPSSTPKVVRQNFSSFRSASQNRSFMLPAIVAGAVIFGVVIGLLMATNRNGAGSTYSVMNTNSSKATMTNAAAVANTTVSTNSAPNSVLPQPKQTTSGKIDLIGVWKGKFNKIPATLNIKTQEGETFSGTLSKAGYLVEFTGQFDKERRTVSIKETKVLKTPPDSVWNLGKDLGNISENGREMSGFGSDHRVSYEWSFTKQ
jgi:hypothetical protein